MYRSFQGLKVKAVFTGSSNNTHSIGDYANSLTVYNDSGADMVITVNGISWTIKSTDMPFDECFEPFRSFTITATGAYRAYVRG